jgi:hypothetical protein
MPSAADVFAEDEDDSPFLGFDISEFIVDMTPLDTDGGDA